MNNDIMNYIHVPCDEDVPASFQGNIDISIVKLPNGEYRIMSYPIDMMSATLKYNGEHYLAIDFDAVLRIRGISKDAHDFLLPFIIQHCFLINKPENTAKEIFVEELSQDIRKKCIDALRMLQDEEYDEEMNDLLEIPEIFRGNLCMSIVRFEDTKDNNGLRFGLIDHTTEETTHALPSGTVIDIQGQSVVQIHGMNARGKGLIDGAMEAATQILNALAQHNHGDFHDPDRCDQMKYDILYELVNLALAEEWVDTHESDDLDDEI